MNLKDLFGYIYAYSFSIHFRPLHRVIWKVIFYQIGTLMPLSGRGPYHCFMPMNLAVIRLIGIISDIKQPYIKCKGNAVFSS